MLLLEGRVAGISGIVGGLFTPKAGDIGWRLAFLGGLVLAGVGATVLSPASLAVEVVRAPWMLVVAGLFVGVGTRLGNGCTSGHGVCGLSRMSPRSLASVVTFMAVGAVVAVAVGQLTGGAS
ncbi:MAG: YeeE/YedE family protein [Pseudomonadota bacterium]|nr:YeeE/YedE family protein [Pseudomonadota bacterium]